MDLRSTILPTSSYGFVGRDAMRQRHLRHTEESDNKREVYFFFSCKGKAKLRWTTKTNVKTTSTRRPQTTCNSKQRSFTSNSSSFQFECKLQFLTKTARTVVQCPQQIPSNNTFGFVQHNEWVFVF